MKILIIGGLPASGKTKLSRNLSSRNTRVYSMDNYNGDNLSEHLRDSMLYTMREKARNYRTDTFIVEGLILGNSDVIKTIKMLNSVNKNINEVEIYYYNEDREQCLINDKYRNDRLKDSQKSIMNLPYEKLDLDTIKSDFSNTNFINNIKIVEKEVYETEDWQKFVKKFDIELSQMPSYYYSNNNGEQLYLVSSESWEISGVYNSCWGHVRDVEEEEPNDFHELDELMRNVYPNMTFLQYKKLDHALDHADIDIGDYYSSVTGRVHTCDIKLLYDILIEEKLYDPITNGF